MVLEEKEEINRQLTTLPSIPSQRKWYFRDLKNQVPGRIASQVSVLLRGKEKSSFFPNLDLGNYVVLVNASQIHFSGNKFQTKYYYNHSGYPGGLRKRNAKTMQEKYSPELMRRIIWGMMPKNKLSRQQIKRLFVFPSEQHHLQAQAKEFTNF